MLHQSASLLWPLDSKISGAMYSVVPHIEFDLLASSISFASPKSVSMTCITGTNLRKSRCLSKKRISEYDARSYDKSE